MAVEGTESLDLLTLHIDTRHVRICVWRVWRRKGMGKRRGSLSPGVSGKLGDRDEWWPDAIPQLLGLHT